MTKINKCKIVSSSIASIYNKPSFSSELITQALIWEKLIVIDRKDNWYKVILRDGYIGWIHSFYLTKADTYDQNPFLKNKNNWYWVKDKFLLLSLDDNSTKIISYGSLIPCFEENNIFFTLLPNEQKIKVDKKALVSLTENNKFKKNIVYSMGQLINTPYLWGGKSFLGFDCSGLVQSILNICNVKLPRDSSEQILSNKIIENTNEPNIGDLIFFKSNSVVDHVGLYVNKFEFIHSSGYVKLNSVNNKNENYCPVLSEKHFKTFKIINT